MSALWISSRITFSARVTVTATHPTPPHAKITHLFLPSSPQLLPSCPGSTVTTGTERRWHPGFPSPNSGWRRRWSATGPSVSGTRCRRSSTRWTLLGSTRTVSGFEHLEGSWVEVSPVVSCLFLLHTVKNDQGRGGKRVLQTGWIRMFHFHLF